MAGLCGQAFQLGTIMVHFISTILAMERKPGYTPKHLHPEVIRRFIVSFYFMFMFCSVNNPAYLSMIPQGTGVDTLCQDK